MKGMRGFDFDGTLYRGDSTFDFYLFTLRKRSRCARVLPNQLMGIWLFAMKRIDREEFKARFYSFLRYVDDVPGLVEAFWRRHAYKVNEPILRKAVTGDLVISASPSFLLGPFCEHKGLSLIASEVDMTTGALIGPNCRGGEKVRRFREQYGDLILDEFYTDSLVDAPMAACARRSYLVRRSDVKGFPAH